MEKEKNKLWVFDIQRFLEIHASTLEAAEEEVREIEGESGFEFDLAPGWTNYQDEYEKGERS